MSNYDIHITFDGMKEKDKIDGNFYFSGVSTAYFKNTEELSVVHFHVDLESLMTINSVSVTACGANVPVVGTNHNSAYRIFSAYLSKTVPAGCQMSFTANYRVKATTATEGLYISSFVNENTGETEYLYATQFESTHAREAFPCFDEPALKATFDFKMTYHYREEFTAIFNTEVKSYSNIGDHMRENTYFSTVKMSTYLIAILVSTFNVEGKMVSDGGVGVRILGKIS